MTHQSRAIFPGSFDPFTIGHASIVERAVDLLGDLTIVVGYNPSKSTTDDVEGRVAAIRRLYADNPAVKVMAYSGLTVDAARSVGARWIVRGVRNSADFDYEKNMAEVNRRISGIDTLLLTALPELQMVSSSIVRELASFGCDVSGWLPSTDVAARQG